MEYESFQGDTSRKSFLILALFLAVAQLVSSDICPIDKMADLLKGKTLFKHHRDAASALSPVDPSTHLKGKVVALYFSAHWCPPCRNFTPMLKDFYMALGDVPFEIVFLSRDNSEQEFKEYLKESHGDWCVVPFKDPIIEELKGKFQLQGIPTLIVIKPNGDVVDADAVDKIYCGQVAPADIFNKWTS